MGSLEPLLTSQMAQNLGWTLLHSLWQLTFIGLLLFFLQPALGRLRATSRYWIGCAALALMFVLPAVTFLSLHTGLLSVAEVAERQQSPVAWLVVEPPLAADAASSVPDSQSQSASESWRLWLSFMLQPALPYLVAFWFAGVGVLSLRLLGGWTVASRSRVRDVQPASATWQARVDSFRNRLGLHRPVQLLESAWVQVPTVLGWLKPTILLPISTLCHLSPEQLEAVLVHELGHVKRHDYLVNIFQTLIETILFYHPTVWWIGEWIRQEREHCCDDLAIEVCGNPLSYAHALKNLEALRFEQVPAFAMGASGGVLLHRIKRLVGVAETSEERPAWAIAGALLLTAFVVLPGMGFLLQQSRASLLPETTTQAWIPPQNWATLDEEGRWLKISQGAAVQLRGFGELDIYGSESGLGLPEGAHWQLEGAPVIREGKQDVPQNALLIGTTPDGSTFWQARLIARDPAQSKLSSVEPNVYGRLGLEHTHPTVLQVRFQEKGAYFASRPAQSDVVIGVILEDATPELLAQKGLKEAASGIILNAVPDGLPAAQAGLLSGDLLLHIEGKPASMERLGAILFHKKPGDALELQVLRDEVFSTKMILGGWEEYGTALQAASKHYSDAKKED